MYGVIIEVRIDRECEDEMTVITDQVVPRARQFPGFVAGSWFRSLKGNGATVVMLFDSEDAACAVAELVRTRPLAARPLWSVYAIGTYEVLAQA
jgi:antibiotic biosynthesis monooxygenase (ABM) superfamily enzyme